MLCLKLSKTTYKTVLEIIIKEYHDRFSDLDEHNLEMRLAYEQHSINISTTFTKLELKLIELGGDNFFFFLGKINLLTSISL